MKAKRRTDPSLVEKMKHGELERYRKVLIQKREALLADLSQMEKEALRQSRQAASGDLSNMPIHMADLGSDNFEQEFTLNLIQGQREELQDIDAALEKVGDGTFGQCDTCGMPIPKARLQVVPQACLCIECKRKEEEA